MEISKIVFVWKLKAHISRTLHIHNQLEPRFRLAMYFIESYFIVKASCMPKKAVPSKRLEDGRQL